MPCLGFCLTLDFAVLCRFRSSPHECRYRTAAVVNRPTLSRDVPPDARWRRTKRCRHREYSSTWIACCRPLRLSARSPIRRMEPRYRSNPNFGQKIMPIRHISFTQEPHYLRLRSGVIDLEARWHSRAASQALPTFELYCDPGNLQIQGQNASARYEWFHGLGRLVARGTRCRRMF
jgi:hypothetical protein